MKQLKNSKQTHSISSKLSMLMSPIKISTHAPHVNSNEFAAFPFRFCINIRCSGVTDLLPTLRTVNKDINGIVLIWWFIDCGNISYFSM